LSRAFELVLTETGALATAGYLSLALRDWDDAERQFRAALARDPLMPLAVYNVGYVHYCAERYEEAEGEFRRTLDMAPGFRWARAMIAAALLQQGRAAEALKEIELEADEQQRIGTLPAVLYAVGRHREADAALQTFMARSTDRNAFFVAVAFARRGDRDRTFDWLDRAYQQRDYNLFLVGAYPDFKPVADDPRFEALLRQMNLK
jgi:tetratricopeptide (TPR) repeat protein